MAGGMESLALLPLLGMASSVGSMAVSNPTAKKVLGGLGAASSLGSLAGFSPTVGSTFGMGAGTDVAGASLPGSIKTTDVGPNTPPFNPAATDTSWKDRLGMMRDALGIGSTLGGMMGAPSTTPQSPTPAPPPKTDSGADFQPSAYSFLPQVNSGLASDQGRIGRLLRQNGVYG